MVSDNHLPPGSRPWKVGLERAEIVSMIRPLSHSPVDRSLGDCEPRARKHITSPRFILAACCWHESGLSQQPITIHRRLRPARAANASHSRRTAAARSISSSQPLSVTKNLTPSGPLWPLETAKRAIVVAGCCGMAYTQLTTSPATVQFAALDGGHGLAHRHSRRAADGPGVHAIAVGRGRAATVRAASRCGWPRRSCSG